MLMRNVRGFSLIELMISISLGLLVVAGATGLIVNINSSNASTVESARLTQELRATLQVIADDLRRARRMNDPFAAIGQGALAAAQTPAVTYYGPYDAISSPSAGCILYTYQGEEANTANIDTTGTGSRTVSNDRAIYLATNAGVGSVVLASSVSAARTGGNAPPAATVTCATAGTTLSSNQIDITFLTFAPVAPSTTVGQGTIAITLRGRLRNRAGENLAVTRSVTQIVNIRSPKAGS
ncbi:MAG: prepilin-type N-terminal cleavage/methylation domain-containing protein [Dokdonella sp.]